MKPGKIALALVDDHQIVIDGLTALLKGNDKFRFAFATTDPQEVVDKLNNNKVD
ncbi:MAG: response regulator transcription factor, partial [Chitinophagaceae bacterium]